MGTVGVRLSTWTPPAPSTTARRVTAREYALAARFMLREAEGMLPDSDVTARETVRFAIGACADLADAIAGHQEADLREWAIDHNELGKPE